MDDLQAILVGDWCRGPRGPWGDDSVLLYCNPISLDGEAFENFVERCPGSDIQSAGLAIDLKREH